SARIVGEYMARTLGQQFIIENVVGAGGTTGSLRAMRARPDGYTILMGHIGTHAFSVSLYPRLAYKPDVDFEPIGLVFPDTARRAQLVFGRGNRDARYLLTDPRQLDILQSGPGYRP